MSRNKSFLGALPMESISSVLGFAGGDLEPGRNTVSFSTCGDKEQGFSPTYVVPVDSSSFQPTLHRGHGEYMGGDGKVARHIITAPRKQALRLRFVCRRSTRKCSY